MRRDNDHAQVCDLGDRLVSEEAAAAGAGELVTGVKGAGGEGPLANKSWVW